MTPTIIDALDDRALFAAHFKGNSWGPWRTFLKALFALPMGEAEIELFQARTGRLTPPAKPFNEAVLCMGRRSGKSRQLALIATYLACFRSYEAYLAPGEVATIAVIASDRKQARSIFRFTIGLLRAVPLLAAMIEAATDDAIVLNNKVVIEIHTCSFRVTRGYTFAAVLCDETAFWRDETSANPDVEIFRALRPGLASIPGAMLLNASSPYRRAGVLWTTFQRNYGHDDARVLVWRAATQEMNPCVDQAVIAEAYDDDPEAAASEYGAEFRSDIADFISRTIVEACVEPGCYERPPSRARSYRAFVDAAGGSGGDSMTAAVAHSEDSIPVIDAIRERRPPFSPDDAVLEIAGLLKSYHVSRVEADRWGGDWVLEAFKKHGIAVVQSARPKSELYTEVLPLLNSGRCSLLDHQRLISQLCGLERRTARSGKDSIDHAPGGHDDLANCVAGALLLAGSRPPMKIDQRVLERSRYKNPWGAVPWL